MNMNQDWDLIVDEPAEESIYSQLLPSSLREVWDDNDLIRPDVPKSPNPMFDGGFPELGSPTKHSRPFPFAESAPALSFMEDTEGAVPTLEPEINTSIIPSAKSKYHYYNVQFHPNRIELYKWTQEEPLELNSYVVTEADRGFDIGQIVEELKHPQTKDAKACKSIVRPASHHEISQLPLKAERERRAQELCQAKARELGLPMSITGASFQFDSKKLTFYFTSTEYVDFRSLVRVLFKTFGMRIWMVWHDGNAPIRDVLQRNEHK